VDKPEQYFGAGKRMTPPNTHGINNGTACRSRADVRMGL
jgi:hypothetical protein